MKNSSRTTRLVLCALFAALIAIGAFIKIPIPNVPITMQTLFAMLAAMLLGGKFGAVSVCVYIAVGLAGLPVFTQGGGFMYVLKPSFGYLVGFAVGSLATGAVAYGTKKNPVENPALKRLLAACLAGLVIVYLFGAAHFYLISHLYLNTDIQLQKLLVTGILIFIPGDVLSCILAAYIGKKLYPHVKRYI